MPDKAYLRVEGLSKSFGNGDDQVAAIRDVSFTLGEGRFLSLLGPSGCGKSTLFNIIAGLMAPDEGSVTLGGDSLLMQPGKTGYMLQKDLLLPWRSVADNITMSKTLHGVRRSRALHEAMPDIEACGLHDLLRRRPDELSGGQRQRAALVRTLQAGKPLLLLDEPFGALDAITRLQLQELLMHICLEQGRTVLFVTHDVDEALLLSDEILVMGSHPGRIIAHIYLTAPKPRTLLTLAQPDMIDAKRSIIDLLDREVKQHGTQTGSRHE